MIYDKFKNYLSLYKIIWVDKDYEIRKINIEAETQKKAIIQFFTENAEVETFGVENFTITRCKEKNT